MKTYDNKLKPKRGKVEWVKVGESIFDLQHDLVDGKLFYLDVDDNHYPINNESQLVYRFDLDGVYRKVETEIDERQEFMDEASKYGSMIGGLTSGEKRLALKLFFAGCRFID